MDSPSPPSFNSQIFCGKIQLLPNPPEIRDGDVTDAPAIARLVNSAFRPERFFSDGDRINSEQTEKLFSKGNFFLLFEDGALIGSVYAEVRGERGYFGLLAVEPKRQSSGIGSRLIAAAEQHCRAAGCRFMDLTFVNVRSQLPAYYRRFGYLENGTLPFPADQVTKIPVHLVQMSKPL